jgi:prefoldin subunit 5
VAFLQRRREELLDRLHQTQAAIDVLDAKIRHYRA